MYEFSSGQKDAAVRRTASIWPNNIKISEIIAQKDEPMSDSKCSQFRLCLHQQEGHYNTESARLDGAVTSKLPLHFEEVQKTADETVSFQYVFIWKESSSFTTMV